MKKYIILFTVLFQISLHACAACSLMTPTAEVHLDFKLTGKTINNIHTEWHFSDYYTSELSNQYDKNNNVIIDKSELNLIKKAILDYVVPRRMLANIKYASGDVESIISPKYKNFDLKILDERLIFSYDSLLDIDVKDKDMISLLFHDKCGFFGFVVTDLNITSKELFYEPNLYLQSASILFNYTKAQKKEIQKPKPIVKKEKKAIESTQENLLKQSVEKIKSLFESIKDSNEPYAYFLLLIFAYVYGVIHAIGPGHGKTLVSSYFLSNDKSYSKALSISLAIGLVHTFSAFLLTLIIYFLINTFLAKVVDDTIFYTTKISAAIIIGIAIYLMYKKYIAYKAIKKAKFSFSTTPHISTCSCASCKVENNSTDAALIISAGIIPCPGTITIFIFSLSLGLYYVGFLSAFVMSLGMSTIIFISAILSVAVRKKTSTSSNLKKYLEYASLIIIFILGIILLFQG